MNLLESNILMHTLLTAHTMRQYVVIRTSKVFSSAQDERHAALQIEAISVNHLLEDCLRLYFGISYFEDT